MCTTLVAILVGQKPIVLSTFLSKRKRLFDKVRLWSKRFEDEELRDPYSLTEVVSWWSKTCKTVAGYWVGKIYTYLKGVSQSLQIIGGIKYFYSGLIRAVYFHEAGASSKYVVLIPKVNPREAHPSDITSSMCSDANTLIRST